MNPIEYIEQLEKALNMQLVVKSPKTYSHEEHIKHLLHYTGLIKNIVRNAVYEISLVPYEAEKVLVKGVTCTKIEIDDNLVLFQAQPNASMKDFEDLQDVLKETAKDGKLGKYAILIPADVRCLHAKVCEQTPAPKESAQDEEDAWSIK